MCICTLLCFFTVLHFYGCGSSGGDGGGCFVCGSFLGLFLGLRLGLFEVLLSTKKSQKKDASKTKLGRPRDHQRERGEFFSLICQSVVGSQPHSKSLFWLCMCGEGGGWKNCKKTGRYKNFLVVKKSKSYLV